MFATAAELNAGQPTRPEVDRQLKGVLIIRFLSAFHLKSCPQTVGCLVSIRLFYDESDKYTQCILLDRSVIGPLLEVNM